MPSKRSPNTTSKATEIIPVTMKMSATLKMAGIIHGMEIMSTTWPTGKPGSRNSRSDRLPSTPPSRQPRTTAQRRERSPNAFQTMTPATTARAIVKIQVTPEPRENAAPGLRT